MSRRTRLGRTPGSGQGWLRRLSGYCWRYRRNVVVALGGAVLATCVSLLIPLVQRDIIDNSIVTHKQPVWPLAIVLVAAALLNFAGMYLRRYFGGRLALDVQHDLRTDLVRSLSRLDGARQDELHTGQIVSRSISDVNMAQGLLSMVPIMLGSALLFVLSLVIMLVLSPALTDRGVPRRPGTLADRCSPRGGGSSPRAGTHSSSPPRSRAWWTPR